MYDFSKFNKGVGIPFMENRAKMDIPCEEELHLINYGFIQGDEKPYAVMQFKEYEGNFCFGNTIITSNLQEIESDLGSKENVLKELENVTLRFNKVYSKKNREYTAVTFTQH